jgi:hypothetical protein
MYRTSLIFVIETTNKKQKTMKPQTNTYRIYDSMGRKTEILILASNIKDACKEAKKREAEIGSSFYKVKRCYTGGVKGQQ